MTASVVTCYNGSKQHSHCLLPSDLTQRPITVSLPRELRDHIYGYLWEATPVLDLKCKGSWMELFYENANSRQKRHMLGLQFWLLTCRTTLSVGLDELQRKSTWTIGLFHEPDEDFSSADYPQEWMSEGDTELLNPAATGEMTLNLGAFDNIGFPLDNFEFEITNINMLWTGRGSNEKSSMRIQGQCGKEVERLGKLCLGEGGVLGVLSLIHI